MSGPVSPEYTMLFIDPSSFPFTKSGFQQPFDSFIHSLYLPVCLWMSWWAEFLLNSQFLAKSSKAIVIKLFTIIRNKSVWDTISAHDIPLDKISCFLVHDTAQSLNFNPFGKVIYRDDGVCCSSSTLYRGLIKSTPHWVNGHGEVIEVRFSDSWVGTFAKLW